MAMDFFAAQERARQRTARLIVMFGLAVAGTIAACYGAAAWTLSMQVRTYGTVWWQPALFIKVAGAVLAVVGIAAWYKWRQYAAGGAAVAASAGGRRVSPTTTRPEERRLLNVVEEMAIASGLPVPAVFVLDGEMGINAFAAGLTPSDAAVAVTQGALEQLTRDELQGVIGHEFSHILNGDMRLNLRLGALVFGILVIGLSGRTILWSLRGLRLRGKNNAGIILLIIAAGVTLLLIGYIGYFFGRMAQAAISRQREFLADASAVQFTRNPEGLGSALRRIAGDPTGSRLQAAQAEALGHFLFAQGFRSWFGGLWATHPDIKERIRAIDPRGSVLAEAKEREREPDSADSAPATVSATACLGTLSGPQVARASALIAIIPSPLRDAAREPGSAAALLVGLALSTQPDVRRQQWGLLGEYGSQLEPLDAALRTLRPALRLPLAQLAVASLRGSNMEPQKRLRQTLETLTTAETELSLFEFTLMAMVRRELAVAGVSTISAARGQTSQSPNTGYDVATVLSALAWVGAANEAEAAAAFAHGAEVLSGLPGGISLLPANDFSQLGGALERLAAGSLRVRQQLLQAGAAIIDADGMRTPEEIELLRVVAGALGCPMSLPA
jgi:Zn-dependent protease with chaperone function